MCARWSAWESLSLSLVFSLSFSLYLSFSLCPFLFLLLSSASSPSLYIFISHSHSHPLSFHLYPLSSHAHSFFFHSHSLFLSLPDTLSPLNVTIMCHLADDKHTWVDDKYKKWENSVLETNHFTNVTTVLGETTGSDRVSRYLQEGWWKNHQKRIIKQGLGWPDLHVRCLTYGVATISRLLKMIGLFCKRAL